jgi:CheY-like chemotaxis protein
MKILLIEDNPIDVRLMLYALRQQEDWLKEIVVIEDGEKAIRYLLDQNSSANATNPDVVMLDLHLPKLDGTEVLQIIRSTEGLRDLPVVVLSSAPEEIMEAIVRRANVDATCYITKPASLDEFLRIPAILWRITNQSKACRASNARLSAYA